jgi:hypothetical protein
MCKTDLQPCKLYQVGVKSFQAVTYFIKDNIKTDKTLNGLIQSVNGRIFHMNSYRCFRFRF